MKKVTLIFAFIFLSVFFENTMLNAQTTGNLAYKAPVSSTNSTNKERIVDEILDVNGPTFASSSTTYTVIIDLENPCKIQEVVIYWNQSNAYTGANLNISFFYNDGNDTLWTDPVLLTYAQTITYPNPDNEVEYFTKVKLTFKGRLSLSLREVKINGTQTEYLTNGTRIQDIRDGRMYRTVVLNNQTWFKDNLNYNYTSHSWYHSSVTTDADKLKYGRLYDHPEQIYSNVCPTGWRLPSETELYNLQGNLFPTGTMEVPWGGWYKSYASCYGCQPEGYYQFGTVSHVLTSTISEAGGMITNGTSSQYSSVHTGYFPFDSRVSVRCMKSNSSKKSGTIGLDTIATPYTEYGVYSPDGVKLDTCKATTNIIHTDIVNEIAIYPNPSNGKFSIDLGYTPSSNELLQIFTIDGRMIYENANIKTQIIDISLDKSNQGLFLLKINNSKGVITKKILIR